MFFVMKRNSDQKRFLDTGDAFEKVSKSSAVQSHLTVFILDLFVSRSILFLSLFFLGTVFQFLKCRVVLF